jgi:hypothetical protein
MNHATDKITIDFIKNVAVTKPWAPFTAVVRFVEWNICRLAIRIFVSKSRQAYGGRRFSLTKL